ncbi:LysM peptidoglycan-binding domain-containing protein [Paraglaciecola aquimarina]|uniref:LysM peptidoglycan-binding domain-containing protein n=1 Tax=Paraglaciecola algarum TaxID=3050085 RepID=A0ABS9D2P1_9ALTE|nr:LysM peptidoglycan-binding domain-containing protein [Paraglaciecola sp. G1-23]MCF2947180.1 LysM peptidoglycan-binding domain-containing protein [Paraglaciecola sp. G1-23]
MMIKNLVRLSIIAFLLPLYCFADVLQLKESAPERYVVKKGDTLWDISNLYLDKAWLWPELWRNNVHITNPHLIYPGDELHLVKNSKGEVSLEVVRENIDKLKIKLSPDGNKQLKQAQAIPALPWSMIRPYINNEMIMSDEDYERHPYVLGNEEGAVRYYEDNLVLGKSLRRRSDEMRIIRKQNELFDMQGQLIGVQVRHLARAKVVKTKLKQQSLVKIQESSLEIKRGDRIIPYQEFDQDEISLIAAEDQIGFIIGDLEQHNLLGKFNVVILDLGEMEVSPGTVMGIYSQGPRIIDGYQPKYEGESDVIRSAFEMGDEIEQPALKVGEVIVFKSFDKASYALITESTKVIKRGMIVAKP